MFSKSPFSKTPFSKSSGSLWVFEDFNFTLTENAFVDKPDLILTDELDFIISDVEPAHVAFAIVDSDIIALFLTSLVQHKDTGVSDTLAINTHGLILSKIFSSNDTLLTGIIETPFYPDVSSDVLHEPINISIIDTVSYIFKEVEVVKVINTEIEDSFIILGSIDKLVQLRGDYKLPQINQNLEMWAGEAINIEIQGVLPEEFDSIIWRALVTSDSVESEDIVITKSWPSGNGLIITEEGKIKIYLNFEDTQELGGNRYFHETRIWNGPEPNTIATGRLKIIPSTFIDIEV